MISINTSSISTVKMTDRSVVSTCLLGVSNLGTGLSGIPAVRPASSVSLSGLPIRERNERPTQALEAAVGAEAHAYAFAAAGAGSLKQTKQHHTMWAFRGPEPWSDPA
ncbi:MULTISPECIES: hypothetical protein [unclassified Streptomyces]|uniref:hypothetical protein n=1 Tax=unclassified Streptomyces TaxID=2593676 RepID=UPI002E815D2A|nr:hypothetical protein [Streptomyces sp. NBC_00589]WTI36426.1 hypothetical protein OIC96_16125 [Streptomyces sp. NBC_00775]WUB29899.1 hypothetical protein OHA51_33605 [Streptomyces sp. NBC_00589]